MRCWRICLSLSMVLIVCASACRYLTPPERMGRPVDMKRQIQEVLDWQVEAWNRGDIEGFMEGYWRSPKLTYASQGEFYRGWHTLRDRYIKRYGSAGRDFGRLAFSDIQVTVLSDQHALVLGRWALEHYERSGTGTFSLLFRRTPWGWKISHDHTSAASE